MKLGIGEILIILVVILFVIGPDKIPEFARKFGEGLRAFRTATSGVTKEIRENVIEPLNEAQAPLREALEPINEIRTEINTITGGLRQDAQDIADSLNQEIQGVTNELNQTGTAVKEAVENVAEVPAETAPMAEKVSAAGDENGPAATEDEPAVEAGAAVTESAGEAAAEKMETAAAENLSREEAARRVAEAEKALEEAKKALSLMNHEEQEEIPVDNSEEKE